MKKVNNIIQVVKSVYDSVSVTFHDYFRESFNKSLFKASLIGNDRIFDYDVQTLNKFIDRCVYYRLGISDSSPSTKDIIYDLSTTVSPYEFKDTVDSIFAELVYCAYPPKITRPFEELLEARGLSSKVIELIINKLEVDNPEH